MFRLAESGSADAMFPILVYCDRDTQLVLDLLAKIQFYESMFQMASVTFTTLNDILWRGQMAKLVAVLKMFASEEGILLTDDPCPSKDISYEGALNLPVVVGLHTEPTGVLDFASLYPTIITTNNLCYTTLQDPRGEDNTQLKCFAPIDTSSKGSKAYFIRKEIQKGLLPTIVDTFLQRRADVKALMKNCKDEHTYNILDHRQKALKLIGNSLYGFTGTGRSAGGQLPCLPVAAATTAMGRTMLQRASDSYRTLLRKLVPSLPRSYEPIKTGDTDSIFIGIPRLAIQAAAKHLKGVVVTADDHPVTIPESVAFTKWVGLELTKELGGEIILEDEYVLVKVIMIATKRYIGITHKGDMVVKGTCSKRRSQATLIHIEPELISCLFEKGIDACLEMLWQFGRRLLMRELPWEDFVLTVSLKANYTSKEIFQVALIEKIRQRQGDAAVQEGTRIRYVVCANHDKKATLANKVEEADYAETHNIPLDLIYYIEVQLRGGLKYLGKVDARFTALFDYMCRHSGPRDGGPLGLQPSPLPVHVPDRVMRVRKNLLRFNEPNLLMGSSAKRRATPASPKSRKKVRKIQTHTLFKPPVPLFK